MNLAASDVVGEGKGFVIGNYECELQELYNEKVNPFIGQPVVVVEPKISEFETNLRKSLLILLPGPPVTKSKPFVNPMLRGFEQRGMLKNASDIALEPLYSVHEGFVLPRPPFAVRRI